MPACHAAATRSASINKEVAKSLAEMSPDLYSRALRLARTPSAAEDLVQDTVERAMRFRSNFASGTNLRGWLYRILFSVFATGCRRARLEREALEVLAVDPCAWTLPFSHDEIRPTKMSRGMSRAMRRVPKLFRQAVIAVDVNEVTYKATAQRMRVPVGTVMSRLHRGRRLLAEAMKDTGVSEELSAMAA